VVPPKPDEKSKLVNAQPKVVEPEKKVVEPPKIETPDSDSAKVFLYTFFVVKYVIFIFYFCEFVGSNSNPTEFRPFF